MKSGCSKGRQVVHLDWKRGRGCRSTDRARIFCFAFSPDSNNPVAYCSWSGPVSVLNASTGVLIAGPKCFDPLVNLFSPSIFVYSTAMETRVAAGADAGIVIWNMMTGNVIGPFSHNRNAHAAALVFSSDGKYVTSATNDYSSCVWDSLNAQAVRGPVEFHDRQK